MKDYSDYMDSISVDIELHNKIMRRQKPVPLHRNGTISRCAGMAACIAILFLCVWKVINPVENTSQSPGEINENDVYIISTGDPQGGKQVGTAIEDPSDPNGAAYPLYELTLNNADSQVAASIYIPGHFWHELSGDQIKAVLPDFSFPFSATVNYYGDGTIFNVAVYELSADGGAARFNEFYTKTEIQFAPGGVADDVIYNYEAKESNVYGVSVTAGVFDGNKNDGAALYIASFWIGNIAYSIKLHDSDKGAGGLNRLTKLVNQVVRNGAPDLTVLSDPVIPELRDEKLTLEEARSDSDFGMYLPESVPSRFSFDSARRFINQELNSLSVHWNKGYDYIDWRVSKPTEYDREHVVSADDREKYDMALYPIPLADSVPPELWEYVNDPVFTADELTLDIVRARAYKIDDKGDTPGWRMNFSVLYDDALVHVNIKGASPEQVWEMFNEIAG